MGNICPKFGRKRKGMLAAPNLTIVQPKTTQQVSLSFGLFSQSSAIQSEVAILSFLGTYNSLINHPFIKMCKLKNTQKLNKTYNYQIPSNVSVGSSYFIDNPFVQIQVQQFVLVTYPIWCQQRRDLHLYQMLEETLLSVQNLQYKNITLAYFQSYLGIPLNVGVRVLIGTILQNHRAKGSKYTLLFQDQQTLDYCLKYASQFTGQISGASVTTQY